MEVVLLDSEKVVLLGLSVLVLVYTLILDLLERAWPILRLPFEAYSKILAVPLNLP